MIFGDFNFHSEYNLKGKTDRFIDTIIVATRVFRQILRTIYAEIYNEFDKK